MARPEITKTDLTKLPATERNLTAQEVEETVFDRPIHFIWDLAVVKTPEGLRMADPATGELMHDIISRYPDSEQAKIFEELEEEIFGPEIFLNQASYFIPDCHADPKNFAIVLATRKKDSSVVEFESLLLPGFSQERIEQMVIYLRNSLREEPEQRRSLVDSQVLEKIFEENKEFPLVKSWPILEKPLPYGVFFPELLLGGWGEREEVFSSLLFQVPVQEQPWPVQPEIKSSQPQPAPVFPIVEKSPGLSNFAALRQESQVKVAQVIEEKPRERDLPNQTMEASLVAPAQELASKEKDEEEYLIQEIKVEEAKEAETATKPVKTETALGRRLEDQVREQEAEETITVPLVKIPLGTLIYTLEGEFEPREVKQGLTRDLGLGVREVAIEVTAVSIPQETENNLSWQDQVVELEAEKQEVLPKDSKDNKETVGEEVVKVLRVRGFNLSGTLVEKKSSPEAEVLEIKKLIWQISLPQESLKPAIFELELAKDQNQRAYALLHFLRRVVKKVFGDDVLWTRQLSLTRADEPLEEIKEIEYYLSLLKGSHAQIFAFAS